jgi:hypothetical protein
VAEAVAVESALAVVVAWLPLQATKNKTMDNSGTIVLFIFIILNILERRSSVFIMNNLQSFRVLKNSSIFLV